MFRRAAFVTPRANNQPHWCCFLLFHHRGCIIVWRGDVLHSGGAAVNGGENARLFAYIVGKNDEIPQDATYCDCWHSSKHSEVPANREYAMPCNTNRENAMPCHVDEDVLAYLESLEPLL